MTLFFWFAAAFAFAPSSSTQDQILCAAHPADCIDTRRGTDSNRDYSRGNTFAATALPFAFNMWTPITEPDASRWLYNYRKTKHLGLALTHQASPWMGDFGTLQVVPMVHRPQASPKSRGQSFSHANETALAHHYAVILDNGLKMQLAPTSHAAVMKFDYPPGQDAYLVVDNVRSAWGNLDIDKVTGTMRAVVVNRDWSSKARTLYIFGRLTGANIRAVQRLAGRPMGVALALTNTGDQPVTLKLGTSWIGPQEAQDSLIAEVGEQALEDVAAAGRAAWDSALGAIAVEGGSQELRSIYINNMYRTLLYPNTVGEGQPERYRSPYDGQIYSGTMGINNGFWDTYRAVWPLHVLLRPEFTQTMLQGFVQAYAQSGWTPRWSAPGHSAQMVGSHSDAIFADAYVKGLRQFDTEQAWRSALKNATTVSDSPAWGRPANHLSQYLGYVPTDEVAESASWHLEDCVNDYAISAWAQAAGRNDEQAYFAQRAQSYTNLYSPSVGFFRGRDSHGAWRTGDQKFSPIAWGWEFTEGAPWHYLAPAPFDPLGMAGLYGTGPQALADKIDALFAAPPEYEEGGYGQVIHEMVEAKDGGLGQYAHPNEPVHHMVWMYNAVGQPHKAQHRLRQILNPNQGLYTLGQKNGGGWLGDEDNGQMSAWYVFAAAGLYPASPGVPEYYIGSPIFSRVQLNAQTQHPFTIEAVGNSESNVYVQSAELNGSPLDRTYLHHSEVASGGTLRLTMGAQPSAWGEDKEGWPSSQTPGPKQAQPLVDATSDIQATTNGHPDQHLVLTDNDSSTVWRTHNSRATVGLSLKQAQVVEQYTLTSGSHAQVCAPHTWRLEGSRDGDTWTVLDSRDEESFQFHYQLRAFSVAAAEPVQYLRLTLLSRPEENCLELAELEVLVTP